MTLAMRPRVVLADDQVMVAAGLGSLIARVADPVGQANNGVRLIEETRRLEPDLVISEIVMPVMGGIDAMLALKAGGTTPRFIFVTTDKDPRLAAEALRAGASGYLLKRSGPDELIDAIGAVMNGRSFITSLLSADVLRALCGPPDVGLQSLTARQRDVLRRLAEGQRMKDIATALGLSIRTVEDHKYQLMRALALHGTADLVRFAIKHRLVSDESG